MYQSVRKNGQSQRTDLIYQHHQQPSRSNCTKTTTAAPRNTIFNGNSYIAMPIRNVLSGSIRSIYYGEQYQYQQHYFASCSSIPAKCLSVVNPNWFSIIHHEQPKPYLLVSSTPKTSSSLVSAVSPKITKLITAITTTTTTTTTTKTVAATANMTCKAAVRRQKQQPPQVQQKETPKQKPQQENFIEEKHNNTKSQIVAAFRIQNMLYALFAAIRSVFERLCHRLRLFQLDTRLYQYYTLDETDTMGHWFHTKGESWASFPEEEMDNVQQQQQQKQQQQKLNFEGMPIHNPSSSAVVPLTAAYITTTLSTCSLSSSPINVHMSNTNNTNTETHHRKIETVSINMEKFASSLPCDCELLDSKPTYCYFFVSISPKCATTSSNLNNILHRSQSTGKASSSEIPKFEKSADKNNNANNNNNSLYECLNTLPRRQRSISGSSDDNFIIFTNNLDSCDDYEDDDDDNDVDVDDDDDDDSIDMFSESDDDDDDDNSDDCDEDDEDYEQNDIIEHKNKPKEFILNSDNCPNSSAAIQHTLPENSCEKLKPKCLDNSRKLNKKVRFNMDPVVHVMHTWDIAYRLARKGPWEDYARDSERFRRRVRFVEELLKPILSSDHRNRIFNERFRHLDT